MSNATPLEKRPCYLCGNSVPSSMQDYGRMTRYFCPNCGTYEISSMAKDTLQDSKASILQIVKNANKSLAEDRVISISTQAIQAKYR